MGEIARGVNVPAWRDGMPDKFSAKHMAKNKYGTSRSGPMLVRQTKAVLCIAGSLTT
jgi:hypothetical protein